MSTLAPVVRPTARAAPRRAGLKWGRLTLGSNALLVFLFLYAPILILIVFSFNSTRSLAVFSGLSTRWYAELAGNAELLAAARNSLLIALIATAASTVIGTLTALAIGRYRFALRTAFDANLYLPIVIPEIVMGISLLLFFNQALFPALKRAGVMAATGMGTITVSHIAFNIPFVYIIVRARLADFDRRLEEAAQDLGANEWSTFRRVTLPLLMPGILGGALLAFTLSLDDYLITAFTKGVGSTTLPLYIYSLVRRGVNPQINALSSLLLLGSMALVLLSLAAQTGGPGFTRGVTIGALLGAAGQSVARLASPLLAGAAPGELLLRGALVLLGVLAIRVLPAWREDLQDSSRAAAALAVGLSLISGMAAALSTWLLLG